MTASCDDPQYLSGCSLTAKMVTTDVVMPILSACAFARDICNVSALLSEKQLVLGLRSANDNIRAYLFKVCVDCSPERLKRSWDSKEQRDSLTLPYTRARRHRCPAGRAGCYAHSILKQRSGRAFKAPYEFLCPRYFSVHSHGLRHFQTPPVNPLGPKRSGIERRWSRQILFNTRAQVHAVRRRPARPRFWS